MMMGTNVMNMNKNKNKNKAEPKRPGLADIMFSWSLADVLNKHLYKAEVKQIPNTFSSTDHYMKSFISPLVEETHADLFSKMETLSRAPTCEVLSVETLKHHKPPKDLFYKISLKRMREISSSSEGTYEPLFGDFIALTDVRPKCTGDLNRPKHNYLVALVLKVNDDSDKLTVLASKAIIFDAEEKRDKNKNKNKNSFFAVFLTNLTTNLRIWNALNAELEGGNMNIIKRVLQTDSIANCSHCFSQESKSAAISSASNAISSFKLDDSQKSAILSCVAARECRHQNTVKLIWGPPGTGKTKTVASLLFALMGMKCRTLTCAPTNVAVLGVAARLMGTVREALGNSSYGFGDIVLFGNGERMQIDDFEDLFDVFLDYRVSVLASCFAPTSGWKNCVESMICLLEDPPQALYRSYVEKEKGKDGEDDVAEDEEDKSFGNVIGNNNQDNEDDMNDKKKIWRKVIVQTVKENKNKNKNKNKKKQNQEEPSRRKANSATFERNNLLTFEQFFMKRYKFIENKLIFFLTNLYTHLPTTIISLQVMKKMIRSLDLLKSIGTLLHISAAATKGLSGILDIIKGVGGKIEQVTKLRSAKMECLNLLKSLRDTLSLPNTTEYFQIRNFCLQNACLIFCTVSSSAKLHVEGMAPVELLVVDEAAQLKECESTIPLQLSGLRHAILIGDDRQLPAMVQSKICNKAEFGRSLFERLVLLGHEKKLLKIQYRMVPSISLFPNKEFYGSMISDGPNVKEKTYEKRFLKGKMYGSYSFINVTDGAESFNKSRSLKNTVEVAVVVEIVSKLFKESMASKQKVRVGCLSPYKAQVFALQEKLGKTYSTDANSDFSVNVRSIDGFQGGEEDVIIISTVRSNESGSIGFLPDRHRTNVAITRAKHCLWILGNSATLTQSNSVWKKLVVDAMARGCFYDAKDDKNLAQAVAGAMDVEVNQLGALLKSGSPIFRNAKWKVCFGDDFMKSMAGIKNIGVRKEVLSLLKKLSSGWRIHDHNDRFLDMNNGASSQLLKLYKINGSLNLAWSVEISRKKSKDVQVLKVWDVLLLSEIPKLTQCLDALFGNYTEEIMNRCKCKKLEGNLEVPVSWPADTSGGRKTTLSNTDLLLLESRVASLSLKDEPGPSTSAKRRVKRTVRTKNKSQSDAAA
ncbi:uncharacterized ATP-dependent helicase C29A10.10c-like isoform X1 [Actinidia eriantha]|uniref:uncharacterized ATP-dependent helicase C29A10.10c-like isoform X1 n=1 Tax=Actinidia eriantha TaxID=165200 RepID=UPI002587339E|nr:uncharacterized ATP-dependent helicase C29A10.10c-like isoform X1 [Actinidia eriantha]